MTTAPTFRNAYEAKTAADAQLIGAAALVSYENGGLRITFEYGNQRHEQINTLAAALRGTFPSTQVVNKRLRTRGVWPSIFIALFPTTNQHGHPAVQG